MCWFFYNKVIEVFVYDWAAMFYVLLVFMTLSDMSMIHGNLLCIGFSEASPEHVPWRPSSKMAGIKKNGGFKKQLPLQPKKHDIDSKYRFLCFLHLF